MSQTWPNPEAAIQAGMAALNRGDLPGATIALEAAYAAMPGHHGLLRGLVTLHSRQQAFEKALRLTETGLASAPDDPVLLDHRLEALARLYPGHADVLAQTESWARQQPPLAQAAFRLADTLMLHHRPVDALPWYRRAIEGADDPAQLPAYLAGGAEAAFQLSDYAIARSWLDRAVALAPQNRSARMARATILLALGEWREGLQDYEARLLPDDAQQIERRLQLPRWQGEPLAGRRLLVCAEQGIGDQIRFARQLPLLQSLTGGLVVECAARLVPLLRRSLSGIRVQAAQEERIGNRHIFHYDWLQEPESADCYIEFGSIALRLLALGYGPEATSA